MDSTIGKSPNFPLILREGESDARYVVKYGRTCTIHFPISSYGASHQFLYCLVPGSHLTNENILADGYLEIQASTIKAEQTVKDSGRGPASRVAMEYSPLLSGCWSLSAEKSRTFNFPPQIGTEQNSHLLSGSVV